MQKLRDLISENVKCVAIAGHVNPDGDCVGSCSALVQYLNKTRPEIMTDLYLEDPEACFYYLKGLENRKNEINLPLEYDLFILCDVSSQERIGVAGELYDLALHTLCIDHHISNSVKAEISIVKPDASSCCEVLMELMDEEMIDRDIAEALYTGIIHDSGVFQYSNTTPSTLRKAAVLIGKGFDFSRIIDESFNQRTFTANKITGLALEKSELFEDGKIIVSYVSMEEQERFHAERHDLGIAVSQLRLTKGVEAAVFLYELEPDYWKCSLRSNRFLNVAEIAGLFSGGGHEKAAGFSAKGKIRNIIEMTVSACSEKLKENG